MSVMYMDTKEWVSYASMLAEWAGSRAENFIYSAAINFQKQGTQDIGRREAEEK